MTKAFISSRTLLIGLVLLVGISACVYDPGYAGRHQRWPQNYHYPNNYDYYFYPSIDVYFQYSTGLYYYHDNNKWHRSKLLPPTFFLDPKDRVIIRDKSDKPYIKSKDYHRDYKVYPDYRRDKKLDRKEREFNIKSHKEYQKQEDRNENRKDR